MNATTTCTEVFTVDRLKWQSMSSVSTLTEAARRFKSRVVVRCGKVSANAKSLMSLMMLDLACQNAVTVIVRGHDASAAMKTISQILTA